MLLSLECPKFTKGAVSQHQHGGLPALNLMRLDVKNCNYSFRLMGTFLRVSNVSQYFHAVCKTSYQCV